MGMFDSVMVPCPKCSEPVEFQSKTGDCQCDVFTLDTAPREILFDIMHDPEQCRQCGNWLALIDPALPRPRLRAVSVHVDGWKFTLA
jgi:hypothetical protein